MMTAAQLAKNIKCSTRHAYRLIKQNKLPEGYALVKDDANILAKITPIKKIEYKHPSLLTAETIVKINQLLADPSTPRKAGKVNLQYVANQVAEHYTTISRFVNHQFKKDGEHRADKGKCRKLTRREEASAKEIFETLLLRDAQRKVALAIEKTEMNCGIKIPRRKAYEWAEALKTAHRRKHNPKDLLLNKGFHVIRDLWAEYENFNDCVCADEWKVDEFGVWIHSNDTNYNGASATAYIVAFQDMKTRHVELLITQGSVTTQDTIKAALNWVLKFGRPKKFLFENAKTWKNEQFLRFVLGLYDDNQSGIEFAEPNYLYAEDINSESIIRTRVGRPEGKPVERTFRIIKDEFCAYSESYSPNMFESRKPNMDSGSPEITRSFEQLRIDLINYMQNDFINRERIMFKNRMLSLTHEDNKARPASIAEAFNLAYATYIRVDVDPLRLAYLYADKYKRKLNGFQFEFIYPVSKERMIYIPDDISAILSHLDREVVLLVNQYNIYTGWLFDAKGKLITSCADVRMKGVVSRDQANQLGKANAELLRASKRQIKALEEKERLKKVYTFSYEKTLPEADEDYERKIFDEKIFDDFISAPPETKDADDDNCIDIYDDDSLITNKQEA